MSYSLATRPGGGAWTWSDIDNLKASIYLYTSGGLSVLGGYDDYGQPYYIHYPNRSLCDQVWVQVTYYETTGVVPCAVQPIVPNTCPLADKPVHQC